MSELLTVSKENYLLTLLELSGENGSVRSADIAAHMNISRASVSHSMVRLRQDGYVFMERYGPVRLSGKGRAIAQEIRNRQRVIKAFLMSNLGINDDIAAQQASQMEPLMHEETIVSIRIHTQACGQ